MPASPARARQHAYRTWRGWFRARLIDAWPTLPEVFRAGILAMVEAART